MNRLGTKTIITKRLILRRYEASDALAMFEGFCNDPIVTKHLTWHPHQSVLETKNILKTWLDAYQELHTYRWAITLKESNSLIGTIDIVKLDLKNHACELGYCLGSKYFNQGYMSEALTHVIEYLIIKADFNRVTARYSMQNLASGKVMEKAGMHFEGVFKEATKNKEGEFIDLGQYAITKKDFLRR